MRSGLRVVAAGSAAVLAASLMACSSSSGGFQSNGGSGSADTAHLRVLVNITPVLTKKFYADLMAPYEKAHPGITVTIEAPTASDVKSTLQQELAAGTAPDLVTGSLTNDLVPQLSGLPADQQWVKDAPYAVQSAVGGKIWQAGSGNQVQSLVFYNKTAFTKAGITAPPKSLDEMTQDLVKLKAAGYAGTQTGAEWITGAQVEMLANPSVFGKDPNFYADRNKGTTTLAASEYAKVLDTYQGWVKQKLTTPNAMGLKYQDSIDQFLAGKSGTYVMGSWLVPTADTTKKSFEVGVFPVPTVDGSPAPVAASPSMPWSILQSSKNQKADLDLVQYLVSDKTAVTAELKAEGNFRKGYEYPGTPLNDAVGAIIAAAPSTVPASDGVGENTAPAGFGDQVNKDVQGLYVGDSATKVLGSLDSWYTSNAK